VYWGPAVGSWIWRLFQGFGPLWNVLGTVDGLTSLVYLGIKFSLDRNATKEPILSQELRQSHHHDTLLQSFMVANGARINGLRKEMANALRPSQPQTLG